MSIDFFILLIGFVVNLSDGLCDISESCIGQTLSASGETTKIAGYNAASGATTSFFGDSILCQAAYSCDSMSFIHATAKSGDDADVECEASSACSNTVIQSNSTIHCDGAHSCINSKIISSPQLKCSGSRSCENTNITGVATVRSDGILALYNAIIDSIHSTVSVINIYLRGHLAAFGASFICRQAHHCHLHCQSIDSCAMFYVDCIFGICEIDAAKSYFHSPINLNKFTALNYSDLTAYQSFDFDMIRFEPYTNSLLCTMDKWTFDDKFAHSQQSIAVIAEDEGSICCRGYAACEYVEVIEYKTQSKRELICSANYACRGSTIQNIKDTVFCQGERSCAESVINYVSNVHCSGSNACADAVITGATNVICSALAGCVKTTVISGGNDVNIYAVSYRGADSIKLYCNDTDECVLHCVAFKSCVSAVADILFVCYGNCTVRCYGNFYCPSFDPATAPSFVPLSNASFAPLFNLSTSSSTSFYTTFYSSFYSTFSAPFYSTSIQIEETPETSDNINKTVIIVIVASLLINILAIYCVRRYNLKQKEAKKEVQKLSAIVVKQQSDAKNAPNKSIPMMNMMTNSTKSVNDMVMEEDDAMEESDGDSLYVKEGGDNKEEEVTAATDREREEMQHKEGEMMHHEEGIAPAVSAALEHKEDQDDSDNIYADEAVEKQNEGKTTATTANTSDGDGIGINHHTNGSDNSFNEMFDTKSQEESAVDDFNGPLHIITAQTKASDDNQEQNISEN